MSGSETPWRTQREAAAGNERRILEAARVLLAGGDADHLEVRDVAREAGVGIGTVYRRFGGKAQLLAAVVGEDERALQDALLSGPPPLGPGAPARERLEAFLTELVALTIRNLAALLVTDATPPGRLAIGAYGAWHLHLVTLLREARPGLDATAAAWHADALLAPLDPALLRLQVRERGLTSETVRRNLVELGDLVARG